MRILFIGDVIGEPGRKAIRRLVPEITRRDAVDLVVANGENAAGGIGITPKIAEEILDAGVHVITTGNHVWKQKEICDYLNASLRILRPANYPKGAPGRGFTTVELAGGAVAGVLNLDGRIFMEPLDCPFGAAEAALRGLDDRVRVVLVDFHAEATSEKRAFGLFLDGKVSAVVGTHTHVQTADETVLPLGTAYITDAGMTGPADSVIGMRKEEIITRFITQRPQHYHVAKGPAELQGVLIEVDAGSGRAVSIRRVRERLLE